MDNYPFLSGSYSSPHRGEERAPPPPALGPSPLLGLPCGTLLTLPFAGPLVGRIGPRMAIAPAINPEAEVPGVL